MQSKKISNKGFQKFVGYDVFVCGRRYASILTQDIDAAIILFAVQSHKLFSHFWIRWC